MKKKKVRKPLGPFEPRCAKCGCYFSSFTRSRKWVKAGESELHPEEHVRISCECGYTWRCKTYEESGGDVRF